MLRCWKGGWELGALAAASQHAGKQVTNYPLQPTAAAHSGLTCGPGWTLLIPHPSIHLQRHPSPPPSTDLLHKHSLLWARNEPRLQGHIDKWDLPCPSRSSFIHVTIKDLILKCQLSAGYSHTSWRDRHVNCPLLEEDSDKRREQRTI